MPADTLQARVRAALEPLANHTNAALYPGQVDYVLAALSPVLDDAERELAEAKKDAEFHWDCRPNRKQAEAWREDAKAMNKRWADEVAAHRKTREKLEQQVAALTAERDQSTNQIAGLNAIINTLSKELGDGENLRNQYRRKYEGMRAERDKLREALEAKS